MKTSHLNQITAFTDFWGDWPFKMIPWKESVEGNKQVSLLGSYEMKEIKKNKQFTIA